MTVEINEIIARKVLGLLDHGLTAGLGKPEPGQMCVEAAICFALGQEHGDAPSCVAPTLRRFKIRLNDARWSSNQARAAGMKRLALIQLGSAGYLDEQEFVKRIVTLSIQVAVPEALRAAATLCKDVDQKSKLLLAASNCEANPTRANAVSAREIAATTYAAVATTYAAAAATYAAAATTYAATTYAAAATTYAVAAASASDLSLAAFAEKVVQILIDMKAPGAQWLYLTEAA